LFINKEGKKEVFQGGFEGLERDFLSLRRGVILKTGSLRRRVYVKRESIYGGYKQN